MMRKGDMPKLSAEAEQAHLDQLRAKREIKQHQTLQAEAQMQALQLSLSELACSDVPDRAKEIAAAEKKKFGEQKFAAVVSITLNAVMRSVPPAEDAPAEKKKGGGGKKGKGSAKPTKVVDKPPPSTAEVRKALRTHKAVLASVAKGKEGELALLRALESWLLSAHGAAALPTGSKVIETIYDTDLVSDEVLTAHWGSVQAAHSAMMTELAALEASKAQLETSHAAAAAAVKQAEADETEHARHKKQAEAYAQSMRCGNHPAPEEEANEKAANNAFKKAREMHAQTQSVLAARQKNEVAERAEVHSPSSPLFSSAPPFSSPPLRTLLLHSPHPRCCSLQLEVGQRALAEQKASVEYATPYVTHAAPFFEWLAASDDDDEDDEEE